MKIKVQFELPKMELDDKVVLKALHKAGPKIATKTRKALRSGSDYDGKPLPKGHNTEAPIDLRGSSGALLRSVKYNRRLREVGAFGPHPTASARAGTAYGLMMILQSGSGRGGRSAPEVRPPFDLFGGRKTVFDDAGDAFEDALNAMPDDVLKP